MKSKIQLSKDGSVTVSTTGKIKIKTPCKLVSQWSTCNPLRTYQFIVQGLHKDISGQVKYITIMPMDQFAMFGGGEGGDIQMNVRVTKENVWRLAHCKYPNKMSITMLDEYLDPVAEIEFSGVKFLQNDLNSLTFRYDKNEEQSMNVFLKYDAYVFTAKPKSYWVNKNGQLISRHELLRQKSTKTCRCSG